MHLLTRTTWQDFPEPLGGPRRQSSEPCRAAATAPIELQALSQTNLDLLSLESSDTFTSCPTHPFPSEGDLTADSNLYVNPLDLSEVRRDSPRASPRRRARIASAGDSADHHPTVSQQESPLLKHRRARFQEVCNAPRGAGGGRVVHASVLFSGVL